MFLYMKYAKKTSIANEIQKADTYEIAVFWKNIYFDIILCLTTMKFKKKKLDFTETKRNF